MLSSIPRPLSHYFRQLFAQVTNPPIDHLREELVFSLYTYLGPRKSLLEESPDHAGLCRLNSPVLFNGELAELRAKPPGGWKTVELKALFQKAAGPAGLKAAVLELIQRAEEAVRSGAVLLILSDRGVDAEHAPISMLLATGAVHHHLIRRGLRMKASLLCETAEVRETHQLALLLGYGASAVNPYLAYETVREQVESGAWKNLTVAQALNNFRYAMDHGLMKIMSKMGISAVTSYQGAQIFETVGLADEVIELSFAGTTSRLCGAGFEDLGREVLTWHEAAMAQQNGKLQDTGFYRQLPRGGEVHAYSKAMVGRMHIALKKKDFNEYRRYVDLVVNREPINLRDLMEISSAGPAVPVEEVEPVETIVKRFVVSGMSHGALSRECHESLAIAMNRLGAKSSSGEGGEAPERFKPKPNGDWGNSKIKQIASGRFGVTPEYAISLEQFEIKMAQGSKPGEGGQIPGKKVTEEIAAIRHAQAGISLISPPPHHDIYSIEDLAQLIYDLKRVNPEARVVVKLVSEVGIGAVAAGVAKGHADVILVSGSDGGTGASPRGSIKHAGLPWELGLAETQQTLQANDLRHLVRLRADGGMRTARDVLIAALLGAEEYGFGTTAVIAAGCIIARECHLNTCPVGVATQDPVLRAKLPKDAPERVEQFMRFLAQELRIFMAGMGVKKLDDLIGRPDLLKPKIPDRPKLQHLDLSKLLAKVDGKPRMHLQERNDWDDQPLEEALLPKLAPALEGKSSVVLPLTIRNTDRTTGARIAGQIAKRYGDQGLPNGVTVDLKFNGTAGQSFGAFGIGGLNLTLIGEANDYVGKSMHGGRIVLIPPASRLTSSHQHSICGNTVLYGATGGHFFAAGQAGERFAVRNSGAVAVLEGLGDHGCEYMTGGIVVVLGETGRNFGAGMTGGAAYVLDEEGNFQGKCNYDTVKLHSLDGAADDPTLTALISEHVRLTGSSRGQWVLDHWESLRQKFWKVAAPAPPRLLSLPFPLPPLGGEGRARGVFPPRSRARP